MIASECDCSGISSTMLFGLLCYNLLEYHIRHSILNDLIRFTVRIDPSLDGLPRQNDRHSVVNKADLFTRLSGEDGEDGDLNTRYILDSVKSRKPSDSGSFWLDHVFIAGLGFPGGCIDQMFPFKVVRCRDDAAATFPAFFEGGLCAGRFHPGVDHGRRGARKGEAPHHGKDSSCARSVRRYDRHNIGRADFSLCDQVPLVSGTIKFV